MKKIPKIVHLYWGGSKLSYLHLLTVKSLLKHNEDCVIKIHTPTSTGKKPTWGSNEQKLEYTGECYFHELSKMERVDINVVDFEELGFSNEISEVHKSDILRLYLLSTTGGIWSDFDILYTKPLSKMGIPDDADTVICIHPTGKYHIIGFFCSSPGNEMFSMLFKSTKTHFDPSRYQSVGSTMLNGVLGSVPKINGMFPNLNVYNLPHTVLYAYGWMPGEISSIFHSPSRNIAEMVGIHWYNGSDITRRFLNEYDKNRMKMRSGYLSSLIKEIER